MKNRFLVFCFVVAMAKGLFAQKSCMNFSEANHTGISMTELDSLYPNAVNVNPDTYAVFRGKEEEFGQAYREFIIALAKYLNENDFIWGEPKRCFNKIYFNENGEVDYFLFNFKPGTLSEEKQERFAELLESFKKEYKIQIKTERPFSQCSPIVYQDF